jgi:hypothetical protein
MEKWTGSIFCGLAALGIFGWATNVLRRGSAYIPHRTKGEWQIFSRKQAPINYWGFVTFLLFWSALMAAGAIRLIFGGTVI